MDQCGPQNADNAAEWYLVRPVEPDPTPVLGVVYRLPLEAQYWGGVSSGECLALAEQYSRLYMHTEVGLDPISLELPAKSHSHHSKRCSIFHTLAMITRLLITDY
jgi:hypothetical protein